MHIIFTAIDIPKEPKTAIGLAMPTASIFVVPIAPTPMGLGNFLSLVLSSIKVFIIIFIPSLCLFLTDLCCTLCLFSSPTFGQVALTSRIEVGSSSATISGLASEATTFFSRFDQAETDDLDPVDFWGARALYIDFHGFWVLEKCITHLEAVYSSHGDFMQEFLFWSLYRGALPQVVGEHDE